jgi:hypothetical protein
MSSGDIDRWYRSNAIPIYGLPRSMGDYRQDAVLSERLS